ncbi:Flp pilus assembly protein TadD, contains TPR repeats [Parasphingorhabdus marina DSM 22363]|uniref:Flp pilus assembly protein TadD, contains TPR repeats n=1 Tax=Parasphingorhabdus marina DSM 22363 TaxID=1123272 RepID=A0A1N6GTJ4_9SPHN|nr:SPOR domain-containing protein [Parasphingorhabdus marina]SIO10828.1 Flp pilus assembly protein TadD, contains TPR repeats [Parasphingorhabdus marina DSM 22363]
MNWKHASLAILPVLMAGLTPAPVFAQSAPGAEQTRLQDALRRIARNSNDSSALADAGLAALDLGDTRAAIGFLAKADQIYPRSGRVKAGLARALLKEKNPFGALRYFDEAIANGFAVKDIAADRGLAYDLIGRNADAQKDYAIALQNGENDELLTRYAVSLGISGDLAGSEEKLYSLLQKSDRTAWRNRVFILAMNEQTKEANKIARQTMTRRMAEALKPFLKRMPKLTAAQKAAAVHFGHFPASENVGVDVASVRFAANSAVRGGEGADAGLIPIGKPLGEDAKKPRVLAMPDTSLRRRPGSVGNTATVPEAEDREITVLEGAQELPRPGSPISADRSAGTLIDNPARGSTESARPGFETAVTVPSQSREQPKSAEVAKSPPALVSQSVERKVEIAGVQPPVTGNQPASSSAESTGKKPVQLVNFDLATAGTGSTGEAGAPIERKPLSDIIGAINIPEREKQSAVVPVDLAQITPAKPQSAVEKAEESEPVKAEPEHPRRFWVQLATGSNASALKFDYRRFARKSPDLFKGKEGWTSPWGRMTRLVVGPFEDLASAKKFEADFRKGGGDGFAWISADGTVVKQLAAK